MAFKTWGRPCKAQGCIFKPIGSTLSKLPSLFGDLNKLINAQAPPPESSNIPAAILGSFNVPAAAPAGPGAPLKVYSNKEL